MIFCVASEQPNDWWKVRDWLGRAVAETEGTYTVEELYHGIMIGQTRLWLIWEEDDPLMAKVKTEGATIEERRLLGAVTSVINDTPGGRVCQITFAGGIEGETWWQPAINTITADARRRDCERTVVIGRRGWQQWLLSVGFKPTHTIFVRAETDGNKRDDSV